MQTLELPGYDGPSSQDSNTNDGQAENTEIQYNIPPALWMIVFLIIGYMGIRYLLED